jgi:hypothetical protein
MAGVAPAASTIQLSYRLLKGTFLVCSGNYPPGRSEKWAGTVAQCLTLEVGKAATPDVHEKK